MANEVKDEFVECIVAGALSVEVANPGSDKYGNGRGKWGSDYCSARECGERWM